MRWTRPSLRRLLLVLALLPASTLLWLVRSAEEKRLYLYTASGVVAVPVTDLDRREYVSLQDVLPRLGPFSARQERGTVRLRVGSVEGEFRDGLTRFRIGRMQVSSSLRIHIESGGRVLAPLDLLPVIIRHYTGTEPEFRAAGRRLFLQGAQTASIELRRGDPSTLVLTFPAPVSPNIASEGARIRLTFLREPVVMSADRIDYQDKLIQSIAFAEPNGAAEITVQGSAPMLASFAEGGRVITLSAAPAPVVAQAPPPSSPAPASPSSAAPVPAPPASAPAPSASSPAALHAPVPFFVLIDPGHGGDDAGVRFSDHFLEKDVTLALARRLRAELQDRGVTAVLLRDSDAALSLDQRAEEANLRRAGMYISLHAGGPGTGVRVYSALMPPTPADGPPPLFVPWESVQSAYLERSRLLAAQMVTEFSTLKLDAQAMPGPAAPLNRVAAPAVALEVAPPRDAPSLDSLASSAYQRAVAQAAALAVVNVRARLAGGDR